MAKNRTVYEVCYNTEHAGAYGDGIGVARFPTRAEAESFAKGRYHYSGDAKVFEAIETPAQTRRRYR